MTDNYEKKKAKAKTVYNKKSDKYELRDAHGEIVHPPIEISSKPVRPKAINTPRGIELWDRIISGLQEANTLTSLDESVLCSYVKTVELFERISSELDNEDLMIEGSLGQLVVNPLVKQQSSLARDIAAIGTRLHLDPVSRNHIQARPIDPPKENLW